MVLGVIIALMEKRTRTWYHKAPSTGSGTEMSSFTLVRLWAGAIVLDFTLSDDYAPIMPHPTVPRSLTTAWRLSLLSACVLPRPESNWASKGHAITCHPGQKQPACHITRAGSGSSGGVGRHPPGQDKEAHPQHEEALCGRYCSQWRSQMLLKDIQSVFILFLWFWIFLSIAKNVTFWGWGAFLGSTPVIGRDLKLFLLFFCLLYARDEMVKKMKCLISVITHVSVS